MNEIGSRLVLVGANGVEVETFDVPEPGPGQILIRVNRSQVSAGSEKNALLGASSSDARRPTGYTTVGVALAVGAGAADFAPGDRVLTFGNHGSHWLVDSTAETEMRTSIQRIGYDITDEQAAFAVLGDVSLHGVRRAELQIDESVAIFGQGVVGQLVTAFCRLSGAYPIIAIDLDAERLKLAGKSGATHTVDASKADPVEAVRELTGDGAQSIFHATRDSKVLVPCMEAAADRGKLILVGSPPGTVEIGLQVELLRRELDIRGTYLRGLENNPHPYWPWTRYRNRKAVMRLIDSGDLQVDHLISHVAKPEAANALFQKILAGTEGWMSVFFDWTGEQP